MIRLALTLSLMFAQLAWGETQKKAEAPTSKNEAQTSTPEPSFFFPKSEKEISDMAASHISDDSFDAAEAMEGADE